MASTTERRLRSDGLACRYRCRCDRAGCEDPDSLPVCAVPRELPGDESHAANHDEGGDSNKFDARVAAMEPARKAG